MIARYLNTRLAHSPRFTADNQHLVFISDITGVPQVWRVRLPDGDTPYWPEQITFTDDRVQAVMPSPVDDRIVYAHDVGGDENAQLYLLDGDREICLTEGHAGVMHIPGSWSPDGSAILFAANRRHPALFDLYVQPIDGGASLVWENDQPGYLFGAQFSPDGQRAIVMKMMASFNAALYEVDLATGTARLASPETENVRYFDAAYDDQSVLVRTDEATDFLHIARLDPATQSMQKLIESEWDIEALKLSPDGRWLVYAVNADGATELYAQDMQSGTTIQADLGHGTIVSLLGPPLDFSSDSQQVAFAFMSATRTADCYVWNLAHNQVLAATRSSHGGVPTGSFVEPELIRYPTFDDLEIPAWFYRPQSDQPLPVIVIVHGGPEGQSRPAFSFLIQYFVRNGYAVFVPNVRGSVGYGKAYSHLDDVEKRMHSVADLAHGAEWLKTQPCIDGDRLVVYGGSYGGFMVLSALTTYPDLWVAGVDIVGISNFVTFLENTSDYRRAHREAEYGSLERDRDFLERISPSNHVDRITAPLLVIHGENDPRVPVSEAAQIVEALKSRDVPVEFMVFDDEGHGIVKLKNKLVMYPAVVDFLNTHIT